MQGIFRHARACRHWLLRQGATLCGLGRQGTPSSVGFSYTYYRERLVNANMACNGDKACDARTLKKLHDYDDKFQPHSEAEANRVDPVLDTQIKTTAGREVQAPYTIFDQYRPVADHDSCTDLSMIARKSCEARGGGFFDCDLEAKSARQRAGCGF